MRAEEQVNHSSSKLLMIDTSCPFLLKNDSHTQGKCQEKPPSPALGRPNYGFCDKAHSSDCPWFLLYDAFQTRAKRLESHSQLVQAAIQVYKT